MYNKHDEIKKLLEASRSMLSTKDSLLEFQSIKKQYGILNEQYDLTSSDPTKKINVAKSVETEIEDDELEDETIDKKSKRDKKETYRISGGLLVFHGKDQKELKLTSDEKTAFQETMEEFVNEVSDLVEFNQLNVYPSSVEWSGKLIEFNVDFMYLVGEENGVYMKGEMITMSDDFMEVVQKLKGYYEKFKSKWAKILGNRKTTKISDERS